MTPILSVQHLSTGYGKKQVLFDVSLDVMPGEILLITGGNGSGKSTLLKVIYGLLPAWNADAEIIFRPDPNGPAIRTTPPHENLHRALAYLPQKNAVFDDLTVEDNLRLSGDSLSDCKTFATRREEVLESLPAVRPLLRRKPEKMSGGERQVVALGMLLLHRPRLVMLDEPTAGLDSAHLAAVTAILQQLKKAWQITLIVVEHRSDADVSLADRTCTMRLGRLVETTTNSVKSTRVSEPL